MEGIGGPGNLLLMRRVKSPTRIQLEVHEETNKVAFHSPSKKLLRPQFGLRSPHLIKSTHTYICTFYFFLASKNLLDPIFLQKEKRKVRVLLEKEENLYLRMYVCLYCFICMLLFVIYIHLCS